MIKLFRIALITLILNTVGTAALRAQELMVPDNDKIFADIIDSNSRFYYPSLFLRFQQGDTELTLEDYHYLYYGYAYSANYKPLEDIPEEANILMIMEKYRGTPDYNAMFDIIYNALVVMEHDPFSPNNLNFLTFAYGAIGDTINERINHDRMTKVLRVIEASGTGLSQESPMHILRFAHASDWVSSKGLQIANRRVMTRAMEFITLSKREGDIWGYYFDFSRVYWNKPENQEQRRPGWQINDVPIGRARKN